MGARPRLDGDELRVRAFLTALAVRPFGHQHQEHHVPDDRPITPTRIIPAGVPLPARAPEPDELPPWRTPPPPPPAPPADPPPPPTPPAVPAGPLEVRHIHEIVLVPPAPEPRPLWARLWDRLVTWRMVLALLAALVPWADGNSLVGHWAGLLHDARTQGGIGGAYVIAALAITVTWAIDRSTSRLVPRIALITTTVGSLGVLDWFDPITLLTGVTR